jgi:hypothetical protein
MRKLFAAVVLVLSLLPVTSAFADSRTWEEPEPKQGYSGFLKCISHAEVDGNSYTFIYYEGFDKDQPVASERQWQIEECRMVGARTVVNYFQYTKDVTIDPASVQISYHLMP